MPKPTSPGMCWNDLGLVALSATKSDEHILVHSALHLADVVGHIAEGDSREEHMNQFESYPAALTTSIALGRVQAQRSGDLAVVRGDGGLHEVVADADAVWI